MEGDRERLRRGAKRLLADPALFSRHVIGRPLRPYQVEVARAVLDSVWRQRGLTFTVMLARQMGKNELSAHLECYLLNLYRRRGGTIVKAAPTFRPQAVLSRLRLREVLDNCWNRRAYRLSGGYSFELGRARLTLLSGAPEANVVGATASILLEIDEAQDFSAEKYDRDFRPMGATANVTTVLYGTAWTPDGLLEREKRRNLELERQDGVRRHFQYDWRVLAALLPEYGRYVEGERARMGASHPLFRSQYELEVLADEGRLLSVEQRGQLQGEHARHDGPMPGWHYVAGVDLAGAAIGAAAGEATADGDGVTRRLQPGRDSTVVTIAALADEVGEARGAEGSPFARVKVVRHYWWTGRSQADVYRQLLGLLDAWGARRVAVDASGLGAGVAGFLATALGERVEQFVFSQASKSRLGFELLAAINRGDLSVYRDDGSPEYREFWRQIGATRARLRANQTLDFFVPEGEGHDDFVTSLALCLRAAGTAPPPAAATVIAAADVLGDEHWGEGE